MEATVEMRDYEIQIGKYAGKVVKGELTSSRNVKTIFGNYYLEPDTIREINSGKENEPGTEQQSRYDG